ncbi:hypothetical protein BUZ39_02350 [Staphylococcus haemolyticus]|nr:hypothetical protein BUZ39_02350 [Staphylococcus haemolyticus]
MKLFSVLVRGPNKENFTRKFYKQSKLGVGAPTQKITKVILQAKQVGVTTNSKEFVVHSLFKFNKSLFSAT